MGNKITNWQDADHVLSYFGKQLDSARKHYNAFVSERIHQGHSAVLIGGGLICSLGGWSAINRSDLKAENIKSDERIRGDNDFVDLLISGTDEKFVQYYDVKRAGYDLDQTAKKTATLCNVAPEGIFSKSRQKTKVKARRLFCYWASRELGMSLATLARQLGISAPAVSCSVERG